MAAGWLEFAVGTPDFYREKNMNEYKEEYELIQRDPIMGTETVVKGSALTWMELQDLLRFVHASGYYYITDIQFLKDQDEEEEL
jgi:hypothetical protein